MLGEDGYRYLDSTTRVAITRSDGARLRVLRQQRENANGIGQRRPLRFVMNPEAWENVGGALVQHRA